MRIRVVACAGVAVATLSCDIVAPDPVAVHPTIVLSVARDFKEDLLEIDTVWVTVTKPDSTVRDTLVVPLVDGERVRVRTRLRPDEGEANTTAELVLYDHFVPLFYGAVQMRPDRGWPFEVRVPALPIATLELGSRQFVPMGEALDLSSLEPIVFLDGRTRSSTEIAWESTNPWVAEVVGSRVIARSAGLAGIVGRWGMQIDTLLVEVPVTGELIVNPDTVMHYLTSTEVIVDTVSVESRWPGYVGLLSAEVDPDAPWLSATLASDTPPTELEIRIDPQQHPGGRTIGHVVVHSSESGVGVGRLTIEARGQPSAEIESRRWSPLCVFGDSIRTELAGATACVDFEATAWLENDSKRITLTVRNLHGSLGGQLDTADSFLLQTFGFAERGWEGEVSLLGISVTQPVATRGAPGFELTVLPPEAPTDVWLTGVGTQSAIEGCTPSADVPNAFITCDASGQTGSVHVDLVLADPYFSLLDAVGVIGVRVNDSWVQCGTFSAWCHVPEGAP